jgi:hypothetical protein
LKQGAFLEHFSQLRLSEKKIYAQHKIINPQAFGFIDFLHFSEAIDESVHPILPGGLMRIN